MAPRARALGAEFWPTHLAFLKERESTGLRLWVLSKVTAGTVING
jgi:hypothetical protein